MITFSKLMASLKSTGHVDAILIVISSQTRSQKDLGPLTGTMDSLVQLFSTKILENCALIFTRWKYGEQRHNQPHELGTLHI